MFRKLISNLPYSPSLITEVSFYAQRLRKEEVTRRLSVIFIVLALVMQSLAVFSPPESANAANEQDLIRGGVSDLNDLLARYDHNEDDLKDIYTAAGVTRNEISSAHAGTITKKNNTYIMSRFGQLSAEQGEVSMSYQRSSGGAGIRYFSPLASTTSSDKTFNGWIGKSTILGWFAIVQANGSLATHGIPNSVGSESSNLTNVKKTVTSVNLTQLSTETNTATARPSDKISYTLKLYNTNRISATTPFSVNIGDVLEYASLIDGGGGSLDTTTHTLSWPQVQLRSNESQERTFVVQLLSTPPSTATGQSNPASFDCRIRLVFGNSIETPIDCPPAKIIESLFSQLPTAGIGINVTFAIFVMLTIGFFYLRTRQLKQEIRMIRHNFNAGII